MAGIDAQFEAQLMAALEESREEEKNRKLRAMIDRFPTIPHDVIHQHLDLADEDIVVVLTNIAARNQREAGRIRNTRTEITVVAPTKHAPVSLPRDVHPRIDMEKFNSEQVAEALWAELNRRQKFVEMTNITRDSSERTKILLFLGDNFTMVKRSVINGMISEMDFYQCILILGLLGYEGYEQRLRQNTFLPSMLGSIRVDEKSLQQRESEAKRMHQGKLPDFASNMWQTYLDIINSDYTKDYLSIIRFDCPVCYDTFYRNDAIFCTSLDPELGNHEPHMFCKSCVHDHAISVSTQMIFGKGGSGVTCLGHGCKGVILEARVSAVLNDTEKEHFGSRIQNAALQETQLKNFVKCKQCNYGVINDVPKEKDKIFICQNSACGFEYCRLCDRPYDEKHKDKTCDQVLTASDEARIRWEEKLTQIRIRVCPKCAAEFQREDGCSKMTCSRCGTIQCYICRKSPVDYSHFSDNGCPLHMNNDQVAARDEAERQRAIEMANDEELLESDRMRFR